MRIRLRVEQALVLLIAGWTSVASAQGTKAAQVDASPVELVRTLQALQDQIAAGSTNAHVAQRVLLSHIDERLISMEAPVWKDPKNIRAAVTYVLSGGRPDVLKKVLSFGELPSPEGSLAQGALAYVEGREGEAQKFLSEVDAHKLPVTLSGQVALIQAALTVREDPGKSVALLDFARLQLPGTLVEEAALRREIFVVGQMGDSKKFDMLSRQYLRRFRYSVYAGNFRQRFAAALTRLEFTRDPDYFARLVATLNELEPAGQLELYLLVARAAVNQGQMPAAILAANKAKELSKGDAANTARSNLYRAAAVIVSPQGFEEGLSELKKLDRTILQAPDIALLESALAMASYIRENPQTTKVSVPPAVQAPDTAERATLDPARTPTPAISRAQQALGAIDQLVRKENR
ncbi:chemotaxis protein [Microvirga rosea]|uniref:chemotaxis protein n=1 Tax=Microvirga rosea TaxID=2715425 RepID=UPI001D0A3A04|nr:chemotaxis protein [Microvirga rosea]MCB8823546.1 chemotaxis protein [Microvirga rosea]